jgi:Outer membrane protein beta-barrel domain
MKNSKHALIALLVVTTLGTANAQNMDKNSGYYGEIGYTPLQIDIGGGVPTFKPKLMRFIVGKDVHENLSVEGMFATTASKDSYQGVDISANSYGIFLKPKIEVAKDTQLFARVGYAKSELKLNTYSDSSSSISYGVGAQTKFTKDIFGGIDYTSFYKKDGVTAKGLTVSVGTRF